MPSEEEVRELVRRSLAASQEPQQQPANVLQQPPPVGADAVLALGCDHGGFALKEVLKAHLQDRGVAIEDCGTSSTESVDYPDFAHEVAVRVADGRCRWGVIIDGAGIGSSMVANKVPGVRAALCYDLSSARNSREHNHANVLTLGAGLVGENLARQILDEWLATAWGSGRHARRVEKITALESRYTRGPMSRVKG